MIKHIDANGKTSFKQVKTDIDISILEKGGYKLEDVLAKITQNNIGKYKGEDLIVKRGQYGLYVAWGDKKKSLTCFGNRPVENITLEEVTELLDKENDSETTKTEGYLREISENISIRRSKHGDYIYYKTPAMKTPKFFKLAGFKEDHRNCDKSLLRLWIHETYKIK